MDKNQIIGIVLIFAMLMGFNYYSSEVATPVEKTPLEASKLSGEQLDTPRQESKPSATEIQDSTTTTENIPERIVTVENEDFKFKISSKGAKIYDFELKNYKYYESDTNVVLFQKDKTESKIFIAGSNINDKNVHYNISAAGNNVIVKGDPITISLNATLPNGKTVVQNFTVASKGYVVDKRITGTALADQSQLTFELNNTLPVTERRHKKVQAFTFARQHATATYLTNDGEHDDIGAGASEDEEIEEPVNWFSFRQRFFTIGEDPSSSIKDLRLTSSHGDTQEDTDYIRKMSATYSVNLNNQKEFDSKFYAGPNDFYTEEASGIVEFGKNVDMGWLIFGVINKHIILPVFDWLADTLNNFGLVIILLVLFIKIILFPIAYKSYSSMAKMKALKPDLDKLKEKHGDDQKAYGAAQMGLYREAGVNPLAGCLPQLLQIPILFALFKFFPNAIQLRQESFLWANDLSTYDALISWDSWIWGIGTHISIFTILMTATTLLNSWYNSQFSANTSNNPAAEQMKYMMYFMPLIFFFVLNDYPSGLTFYYFISTLFTIGQQFVANKMIDTDKIRAKIDTNVQNSANGTAKKSRFQQRLEAAMEQQKATKKK